MLRYVILLLFVPTIMFGQLEINHGLSGTATFLGANKDTVESIYGSFAPKYHLFLDSWMLATGMGYTFESLNYGTQRITHYGNWEFSFGYMFKKPTKSMDVLWHGLSGTTGIIFNSNVRTVKFGVDYTVGRNRFFITSSLGLIKDLELNKIGGYGGLSFGGLI